MEILMTLVGKVLIRFIIELLKDKFSFHELLVRDIRFEIINHLILEIKYVTKYTHLKINKYLALSSNKKTVVYLYSIKEIEEKQN